MADYAMHVVQQLGENSAELLDVFNSKIETHFVWLEELQEQITAEQKSLSPGGG
jgi:hypothetical protein